MAAHSLSEKVVVVTGGVSGIGLATVEKLLKCGAILSVCDIDQNALDRTKNDLGGDGTQLHLEKIDTTNRGAVQAFLENTKAKFGRIDAIAIVAGTAGRRLGHESIWQTTTEEYDFIMDVNVRSTYNVLAESLKPGMINESGGSVVCVGSMFSQRGFKSGAVYSASKHAMIGLVKSAAMEVGSRGIRVNAVLP